MLSAALLSAGKTITLEVVPENSIEAVKRVSSSDLRALVLKPSVRFRTKC